jgi:hypothetical protein
MRIPESINEWRGIEKQGRVWPSHYGLEVLRQLPERLSAVRNNISPRSPPVDCLV